MTEMWCVADIGVTDAHETGLPCRNLHRWSVQVSAW